MHLRVVLAGTTAELRTLRARVKGLLEETSDADLPLFAEALTRQQPAVVGLPRELDQEIGDMVIDEIAAERHRRMRSAQAE